MKLFGLEIQIPNLGRPEKIPEAILQRSDAQISAETQIHDQEQLLRRSLTIEERLNILLRFGAIDEASAGKMLNEDRSEGRPEEPQEDRPIFRIR